MDHSLSDSAEHSQLLDDRSGPSPVKSDAFKTQGSYNKNKKYPPADAFLLPKTEKCSAGFPPGKGKSDSDPTKNYWLALKEPSDNKEGIVAPETDNPDCETGRGGKEGMVAPEPNAKKWRRKEGMVAPELEKQINFYHMGQLIDTRTAKSCEQGYFLCPSCGARKPQNCHSEFLLEKSVFDLAVKAQGTTKMAKKAWALLLVSGVLDKKEEKQCGKVQSVDDVDQDITIKESTIHDDDEVIQNEKYRSELGDEKDNLDLYDVDGESSSSEWGVYSADQNQTLTYKDHRRTRLVVNNRAVIALIVLLLQLAMFLLFDILFLGLLQIDTVFSQVHLFFAFFYYYFYCVYSRDDQPMFFKNCIIILTSWMPKILLPFRVRKMFVTMKFITNTPEEKNFYYNFINTDCRADAMSLSELKHKNPLIMRVVLDQNIPGATYKNRISFDCSLPDDFPQEVTEAYRKMRAKFNSPGYMKLCATFLWCFLKRMWMRFTFVKIVSKKRFSRDELLISSELLQQMLIPAITNPLEEPEMTLNRLVKFVSSLHTVNIPKHLSYNGHVVHQDTVLLAFHMCQRYKLARLDVFKNSLF
jgi:hypothetical protein